MENFDHILNWKLKDGSHRFPGKDGGTCINEAALVACGFEYQQVRTPNDMPACFSRPICSLAMLLNDQANDAERQRLLPFVMRLACADSPEVERERVSLIKSRMKLHRQALGFVPFEQGLRILTEALAIGRQAESIMLGDVASRMNALQHQPPTKRARISAKLRSWLRLGSDTEVVG
ncbi:MAG: hypothetical protein ABW003_07215 [Microvirga sp.]